MNLGGPVWHASGRSSEGSWPVAKRLAYLALGGVGDARLGEWEERGRAVTFHLRRRLSAEEQAVVGDVRDIRGTAEEARRFEALFFAAPHLRGIVL